MLCHGIWISAQTTVKYVKETSHPKLHIGRRYSVMLMIALKWSSTLEFTAKQKWKNFLYFDFWRRPQNGHSCGCTGRKFVWALQNDDIQQHNSMADQTNAKKRPNANMKHSISPPMEKEFDIRQWVERVPLSCLYTRGRTSWVLWTFYSFSQKSA